MRPSFRSYAAAAIASLAVLAGCGDDSSGGASTAEQSPAEAEAAIEETWAAFAKALKRGDGEAACAELSDALARPNEVNFQVGSSLPGGPSCEDTIGDKDAMLSFAAGTSTEFAELEVEGTTASAIAGAAKPTFAESGGEWEITSFFGVQPEE